MLVANNFQISGLTPTHLRGSKRQGKGVPPPRVGGRDFANASAKSVKFQVDNLPVN